ncbi:MAG: hypothetical protein HC827_21140 [Cyanobacteria bacterium RM1_2_2]|nr:hypothetical protein [Cyanobacteria bacterium RM1_2_2]
MTLERKIASAFQMSEEAWARHANPWSGWTRFVTTLPLLVLAVWSRVWLGGWSLIPVITAVLWIWLNPRIFPKPRSTDHWISKGVLGERVWLNRDQIPVPQHHHRVPNLLNVVSALGAVLMIGGLIQLDTWPTMFGATLVIFGKLWFIDRMVWLYEDMKDTNPEYRSWLY